MTSLSDKKRKGISLPAQVFIMLGLGVLCGFFFGEMIAPLSIVGEAFINLFTMSVLPYIVVSLISGFGRLTKNDARNLAYNGGRILLILWGIVLLVVIVIPTSFPKGIGASFFSTSMLELPESGSIVELFIPNNPFFAMANSIIPAIVVFSIAVGIALIPVKNKKGLIEHLDIINNALMRITAFVARIAPIGVFALAGVAAGTLDFYELERLQVYLITVNVFAIWITFWVLPALITSLTPIRYTQIFTYSKDALGLAFATRNLLVVLPMLAQASKKLIEDLYGTDEKSLNAVDILIPTSFTFPNMGKLLTLCFIPFAAWFAGTPLTSIQYPKFIFAGFFGFFGEVVAAIPFLLDLLKLPIDLFKIFISVDVFIAFSGTLLAAMHVLTFSILGIHAMTGRLKIRWKVLIRNILITIVMLVVGIIGLRMFFTKTVGDSYRMDIVLAQMQTMTKPMPSVIHKKMPPVPLMFDKSGMDRLEWIQARDTIRVGYFPKHLPYSYFNSNEELVGMDVELAYSLAHSLDVIPEFVPVNPQRISEQLDSGYCDIVMSGLLETLERAQNLLYSDTYLYGTVGFLVKDHRVADFNSEEAIRKLKSPIIGVGNHPYYIRMLKKQLPDAQIELVETSDELVEHLKSGSDIPDAFMLPLEDASAWSIIFPAYDPVVPKPIIVQIPMAYAVPFGEESFQRTVNVWIELKKSNKTIDDLYDYWILGKGAEDKEPRWSIIRDVLGWVE
jgi:Na+/H+-dicarboxylate symporter/ABC-type amino acid transport substrate-binding protein